MPSHPFSRLRRCVEEPVSEPTTLRIYTGTDGQFTLYEDDGKSLEYFRGQGTWTRFSWHDSEERLEIEPDPRMAGEPLSPRPFSVVWLPPGTRKAVKFSGKP